MIEEEKNFQVKSKIYQDVEWQMGGGQYVKAQKERSNKYKIHPYGDNKSENNR